jgi:hypothetical protein
MKEVDMMKTHSAGALLLACLLSLPCAASAQAGRTSFEARIGATFPTGELEDNGLDTGLALGADVMYSLSPMLTAYAGASRDAFKCDRSEDECARDYWSGGFQAGLKYLLQRTGDALPWVRGGLIGQKMDIGPRDSDLSLGFEVGGGIDFDISPQLALAPALHFRRYEADFGPGDLTVSYLTLSVGVHFHFN